MFLCTKCNKEFNKKYNLERHLNRKIPCNNIIKCSNCLKEFKTNQGLIRHSNKKIPCKNNNNQFSILELKVKELEETIKKLQQSSIVNPNSGNNTFNIDNSSNINITINNFGNEDLSKLPIKQFEKDLRAIIAMTEHKKLKEVKIGVPMENDIILRNSDFKPCKIFLYFLTMIYKNDKFPQNKTIKYNQETKKFEYYVDNNWISIEDNNIIEEIILKITENIGDLLIDKTPIKNENILYYLKHYLGEEYDINKNMISGRTLTNMYQGTKTPYKNYLYIGYDEKNKDKVDNLHNYIIKLK